MKRAPSIQRTKKKKNRKHEKYVGIKKQPRGTLVLSAGKRQAGSSGGSLCEAIQVTPYGPKVKIIPGSNPVEWDFSEVVCTHSFGYSCEVGH